MLFGKQKRGDPSESAAKRSAERDRPQSSGVTVQITPEPVPVVNTAMATHIGVREYQQDAAYVCRPLYGEGIAYAILCDGMGGTEEGERAGSEVVAFMANRIAALSDVSCIPEFLERAAKDANELILEQNERIRQSSGTTLLTVLMYGDLLYWLSVGDSRIYIIREGEIVQVTKDHNLYLELQELVEIGQITQEQADADPRKDHLISYIGAPVLERIDINQNPFQMKRGDIILLCSDGLTKALYPDEISEMIARYADDISEAARVLPLYAFDQSPGNLDNTTVVLMHYIGSNQ